MTDERLKVHCMSLNVQKIYIFNVMSTHVIYFNGTVVACQNKKEVCKSESFYFAQ